MANANDFKRRFLESYNELHERLSSAGRWEEIWKKQWNGFMLWQQTGEWTPPAGDSVLALTARKMNLQYNNGEPLRLDAAFCALNNQHPWFPMEVAIEHENEARGFETEILKLLSIRCRLKVGITYTGYNYRTAKSGNERIREIIEDRFEIARRQGEEHSTEYLFLVGTDGWQDKDDIRPRLECKWYELEFSAGKGLEDKEFALFT
jgi:hypothetical protein